MLCLIHVRNYAVVDDVELELGPGLNVVTGETGAGKSILVDALGLALGDRADAGIVRHGTDRAEVSVLFECPDAHPALVVLTELGLEDGNACMLRRVVGQEGRSRAFINGRPVTLQDLKRVGALLVDIHGQHEHQSLLHGGRQRALVDAHGHLEDQTRLVGEHYAACQQATEKLATQREAGSDREARLELLRFQVDELEALALAADEPAQLEAERDRLANADRLAAGLNSALEALQEAEAGAAQSLVTRAHRDLVKLVEHDAALAEPLEQLASVETELQEIAHTLMRYRDRIEADPQRLDWIENRLAKAQTLAHRHHVKEAALPETLDALRQEIETLQGGSQSLEKLQQQVEQAAAVYRETAEALSRDRLICAKKLGAAVTAELGGLGMPQGELEIAVERRPEDRGDSTGLDRIEFRVRLNPGQLFGPLARMASGGELSRISLALEAVAATASTVPTFVFDEVDTGIGGAVAEIVGRKLAAIAQHHQVLCVTHLAQVASQGAHHYRVIKESKANTTRTNVRRLDTDARIEELSRMLGGLEITERTRAHAEEMMNRAADILP